MERSRDWHHLAEADWRVSGKCIGRRILSGGWYEAELKRERSEVGSSKRNLPLLRKERIKKTWL